MGATPKITPKNGVHGITKENARLFQAKSAITRAKQAVNRRLAIEAAQNVLAAKIDTSANGSQLGQIMSKTFQQLGMSHQKKIDVLTCAVALSMMIAIKKFFNTFSTPISPADTLVAIVVYSGSTFSVTNWIAFSVK